MSGVCQVRPGHVMLSQDRTGHDRLDQVLMGQFMSKDFRLKHFVNFVLELVGLKQVTSSELMFQQECFTTKILLRHISLEPIISSDAKFFNTQIFYFFF